MKRIAILVVCVLAMGYAHAQKLQEKDVPSSVKDALNRKFPGATSIKWEREDNTFEASFKTGKEAFSTSFDQSGKWLETESDLKKDNLPKVVKAAIAKEFRGYKIEKAEKLETHEGLLYEVELEKKEVSCEVQFTAEGKMVKKEEIKESDEKDEKDE
jgi:hypothetical protein